VGHGTTLAGRYRLEERLHTAGGSAFWRAVDQTLDRQVGIRVVTGDQAAETVDAARRASLVEDPRLLRVLDVGSETPGDAGEVTYVVSEFVDGESLATLAARGGLAAEEVRAIVGEAAEALERARAAGLHHRRLTPAALVVTRDGGVKVAGLGVDATLDPSASERASVDGDEAARDDAVALVAVLYAGLTGRWPIGTVDGLPEAPEVSGLPAPPADLVPGVPNDLDTLCSVTFGPHEDGPRTPGELAEQLSPWRTGDRSRAGRDGFPQLRPAGRLPARLGGAVGAAAAVAATAAGVRPEPEARSRTHALPGAGDDPLGGADAGAGAGVASGTPAGRRLDQPKVVLAGVAVLVVLVLAMALNSLSGIGDGRGQAPQPAGTGQTAAPQGSSAPPSQQPAATPAEGAPTIQGVRSIDPQGDDGTENDEKAPLAIDGDAGTAWTSSTYNSAEFGNLKDGIGMVVDLGRPSRLSGVALTVAGGGGTVEVRTAPGPGLDGSTAVGTAEITGGPVDVALAEPVETQYVVLWFTQLPQTGSGFRVELAEVQVR
jgi:hypothetical protein